MQLLKGQVGLILGQSGDCEVERNNKGEPFL